MNPSIKKVLLGVGAFTIVAGSSFAAYKYSDNIQNLFSTGYSDSYTLEEVNEKILTFQKKSVEELEVKYNNALLKSENQRLTGSLGLDIKANSSFGGGSGSVDIENIDFQYIPSGVDVFLQGFDVKGVLQMFGEKKGGNLELGEGHLITNASGSYIQAKELLVDTEDFGQEILPKEIIMTLNKLGETDKYIDLSENLIYDILKAQMDAQAGNAEGIQKFILDFIKNESVLVAYKQEETKYHLAPSIAICTLIKKEIEKTPKTIEGNSMEEMEKKILTLQNTANNSNSGLTYETFKQDYVQCDESEYQKLIDALKENEIISFKNLYIELNTTKLHYVANIVARSLKKGEGATEIETGLEGTLSLTQSESSKMYMRIKNDSITGSGILIEQTGETINGYLDIDVPEHNFDSNLTISGTNDKVTVSGDYSYAAPQDIKNRDLKMLQGVEFSGTIQGNILPEDYSLNIINTFSQGESGANGELTMDINGGKIGDKSNGKIILAGKVQMGENASPMTGNLTTIWNAQTNESLAKGDISYTLEVPNIASGEYKINYDFAISDTLTSDFQTPESIIPQKNLNSLIMINKKKVGKELKTIYEKDGEIIVMVDNNEITLNIKGLKIAELENIDKYHIKDENNVYHLIGSNWNKIDGADPSSFEIIDYNYAKDKNNVYHRIGSNWNKIDGADPSSFEIIHDDYAKDKNNVYYSSYDDITKINEADPDSFELIDDDYTKDKNNVYYGGFHHVIRIDGADPDSFELIDDDYTKDKNNVYNSSFDDITKINGAVPDSFEIINGYYTKDKNNVYYGSKKIDGADPSSFEIIHDDYAKDKNNVYKRNAKIDGADPSSFEIIDRYYMKDKNNVYYSSKKIDGADPKTFQIPD